MIIDVSLVTTHIVCALLLCTLAHSPSSQLTTSIYKLANQAAPDKAGLQRLQKVQPLPATLVTLAALGAAGARLVVQMPDDRSEEAAAAAAAGFSESGADSPAPESTSHHADTLASACRLHEAGGGKGSYGGVIKVDALGALSDAKVQCAVNPGAHAIKRLRMLACTRPATKLWI